MGFYGFLAIMGCKTFQERIASKPIEIDIEKLHTKISAMNIDVNDPSLDFLGSIKPAHEGIKKWYPQKIFRENSCRQAWACYLSQQALVMSFSSYQH